MRTFVYVDAFNLYYGCLKKTPYRWLDLSKLCGLMLPTNQIIRIKYFTALVTAYPNKPNQPVKQQMYIRALKTLPNVDIIYGHYLTHHVWMPCSKAFRTGTIKLREVVKSEEKGSDVNLGTHLLHDAHKGLFDVAVVISNDSDLMEPIRIVISDLGKIVGVINPGHDHPSQVLLKTAKFFKTIRTGVLANSQFPVTMSDQIGSFTKPASW